jgi:homoserine O-succinyltransferase
MADGTHLSRDHQPATQATRARLDIALVNNMPDSAVEATERQFASLIQEACPSHIEAKLTLYALPTVTRGEAAKDAMRERYADLDALRLRGTDALIVTGAEPLKADMREETYWGELAALVDWARTHTHSALWSCLAAHAAVLHMDGIVREPLPAKCSGVFTFERIADMGLSEGLPGLMRIPHSRRNTLPADQLHAKGYRILTQSPRAGVDTFVRQGQSLFVFLQGHPEYEGDTLLREYMRDVGRYLRGQRADYPQSPFGYFDATTERSFRALAIRARDSREARLLAWCNEIGEAMRPARPWRAHAVMLMRNWLRLTATAKARAEAAASASPE